MKFFRRIRASLIPRNGFRKYLLYAFGEIVLVVLGILIAVSINNWNEKRKLEGEVLQIVKQVRGKIDKDLNSIQLLRNIIKEDLKLYNSFLSLENIFAEEKRYAQQQAPYLVTIYVEFLDYDRVISNSLSKATQLNDSLSLKLLEVDQLYNSADKSLNKMEELIGN